MLVVLTVLTIFLGILILILGVVLRLLINNARKQIKVSIENKK